MKVNFSEILLMAIFMGIILSGTDSILIDYAFSEKSSYKVINPGFEGKLASAAVNEKTNKAYPCHSGKSA